ncbi:MAG TPA: PAS domain S-box protein [Anaerolineaceae bacterium]|nr:PAS domain S-box protein [Anaerolineaceae bacterium]
MNWAVNIYFLLILLTLVISGFLVWVSWRNAPLPGVRAFTLVAVCLFTVTIFEILSMVSSGTKEAAFWFNLRFLPNAFLPVFFLVFAMRYHGHSEWLSNRLIALMCVVPVITQVMVWTNPYWHIWVLKDVLFYQIDGYWISMISARVPGIWYLVHTFYGFIFMLGGSVVIFVTAWQRKKEFTGQALLLAIGAIAGAIVIILPLFSFFTQLKFNPFIPGIGISALMYGLAILRFDFLKETPKTIAQPENGKRKGFDRLSLAYFIFFFTLLAIGIGIAGYFSFRSYSRHSQQQAKDQLQTITSLKVKGISEWREERLSDAQLIKDNPLFVELVKDGINSPGENQSSRQLQEWVDSIKNSLKYNRVFVIDGSGKVLVSSPSTDTYVPAHLLEKEPELLVSGEISWMDFHLHEDQRPYLGILVPLYFDQNDRTPLGMLVLEINPAQWLYSYLQEWPVPSETAETLLVEKAGNDVLYLSPLRYNKTDPLKLRISLEQSDVLAVKAIMGQFGVIEGLDYRNQPVIGSIAPIPDSPWFIVSRIDREEVMAPIRSRLWQIVAMYGAVLVAVGSLMGLLWRQNRTRYLEEQVQITEALRASEEKFRKAFLTSPDALMITRNDNDVIVSVNQYFSERVGYSAEEVIGKRIQDIDIWENIDDLLAINDAINRFGHIEEYPAQFHTKNGKILDGLITASMITFNGEPHVLSTTRDITEWRKAERELLASEERYRLLLDVAPVGFLVISEGIIQFVNPAGAQLLGAKDINEIRGRKYEEIVAPSKYDETMRRLNKVLAGEKGIYPVENEYIRLDGSSIFVEVMATSLEYQRMQAIQLILVDITARKRAEEALRKQEEDYRTLTENSPDLIVRFDLNKRFMFINQAAVVSGSIKADDYLGKTIQECGILMEGIEPWEDSLQQVIETGQVMETEDTLRLPDGNQYFVTHFIPEVDAVGEMRSILCIARNITERKMAERAIQEYSSRLEETVTQRTQELKNAQEALLRQERLAALGQVAGGIAHELRNPLGVITNATTFLTMIQPAADEKVKEYIGIIQGEAEKSQKIISDLLNFTRGHSEKRMPIAIEEIIGNALAQTPPPSSVRVSIAVPPELPLIEVNATQIEQVFNNLILNAYQAMINGGDLEIRASVNSDGDHIIVEVSDTGEGIPPDNIDKIFEPLFTTKTKGFGLGLSLSKKNIESNHGKIEVKSQPGAGTTFILSFPIYMEAT